MICWNGKKSPPLNIFIITRRKRFIRMESRNDVLFVGTADRSRSTRCHAVAPKASTQEETQKEKDTEEVDKEVRISDGVGEHQRSLRTERRRKLWLHRSEDMTKEEAIRLLKMELNSHRKDFYPDMRMALEMGINALYETDKERGEEDE